MFLTCADDHTTRITDVESASLKAEMRGHYNRVECGVFVPKSAIAAASENSLHLEESNLPVARETYF
ncbi:hypothetical protein BJ138DRAFT_1151241 [Hygrophoropsis aurantiaca]|uniref:Uncharacterized protein n=1 Tax=Hygrophoropsis aurantiaca TaxID=72124 RepID=A0ACB8ACK0_9AGAM|nr:hypothetical protein BJ138DRAFT_1151241 [Hygrophoropsis aurantiaca]